MKDGIVLFYIPGGYVQELKLNHPVHTLDNHVLLPAGTAVTAGLLDDFISKAGSAQHQASPLIQHGSIKEDLLEILSVPPYDVIFSDQNDVADILKDMGNINIVTPVSELLYYFKQYDYYSYRHSLSIFALSTLLSKYLIKDYHDLIRLAATGPTHDIGKICVPLNVLNKPTPLTRAEKSMLDNHSAAGYVLLSYYLRDAKALSAKVARDHHENKIGSGYPRGIRLNDPMVEIITVCDVYDALVSPRPYRATPFDNRSALEEVIKMGERDEISWDIIKALVAFNRKTKPNYEDLVISTEKRGTPPSDNSYGIIVDG